LKISVVRANLHRRRVAVAPLHHTLTHRHRLTKLAKRPHLVAATNGTYFDFGFGAPTVPLISRSGPLVLSQRHETVAGIGVDGRARDGRAWLVGHLATTGRRAPLAAVNEVEPEGGFALYTSRWGHHRVPRAPISRSVVVRNGHVIPHTGHRQRVPDKGDLLVANSPGALAWLSSIPRDAPLTISYHAHTTGKHAFSQAYGVGTRVVAHPDKVRDGLYCNRAEIYAARTDIAWAKHGRQLILATVTSPKGSEHFGVDENQMSEVMVDLGAARSYALDGGGSTELVARVGNGGLSMRTLLRTGHERPIPVGVGVYSLPKRLVKHLKQRQGRHGKHHKHKHKKPTKPGLLGILLGHH
jgi:hypothetical protein